jgi:hypothetical protein
VGKTDLLDEELVAGLKLAKTKRCYFALVVKGATDGALVVSKQKVPPVLITLAKKKCGGSAVVKGAVFFEDGKYIFETAKEQAATMPNALKLIAKRDAGMAIIAICRVGTDPDLFDEQDGNKGGNEPAATRKDAKATEPAAKAKASTAAANLDAAYQARVKALTENLKKAIASGTPAGNEAKLRFSESQVFARKNDFTQALTLLDAVEVQIKKALAPTAGRAQPKASGMTWLNDLKPAIKAAISSGSPNVARIQSLLGAATGLLKNNDVTQADKVLDELEPLLKPSTSSGGADLTADWNAKLAKWTPAIKAAIVAKGPNAAAVTKLMSQASALSKPGGDLVQALAKLTECHNLISGNGAAPNQTPSAQPAAARWEAARAAADAKLKDEIKVVAAIEHPDVAKAELQLTAVMTRLKAPLMTRRQAAEMERYLRDDDVVADICELAFDLKTPLLKVLAEITPQLSA